ncbi:MAG: methyltransferase domain-containing protein [Patescibacteria group bacterium]|nr:methyltransferase domain-containing protein [Patescibacteria group bacterium]
MVNLLKKIIQSAEVRYAEKIALQEDAPVLALLGKQYQNMQVFSLLEAGSGRGRFADLLKKEFPNMRLTCLEINEDLARQTMERGIETATGDILEANLPLASFDVIHASHIIEHFSYPAIARLLDKLASLLKPGGFLIIRSPLWHPGFYGDIDHVRPYPPGTILHYFNETQQQHKGQANIVEISRWYRRHAWQMQNTEKSQFGKVLNGLFKGLWLLFRFPRSSPNGYVSVFQKN